MIVWVVLRDWEEDIEEYGTHHNDEFCGVFLTEELANNFIKKQPNQNWERNSFVARQTEVQGSGYKGLEK